MKYTDILIAALLASFCLTATARAETVFIDAGFGEKGNGWLFGSRTDERCWIALPWHVVKTGEDKGDFVRWTDQANRGGETDQPIRATMIPGVDKQNHWLDDLAFVRVTSGRADGDCLSRLGLPPMGYVEALRSQEPLLVTYVEEGATVTFEVEKQRALADNSQGAVMLFRARNADDSEFLVGGISGAVVEQRWRGHLRPTGMIVDQPEEREVTARAIRFDHIRTAFEALEAAVHGKETPAQTTSALAFDIVGISGRIAAGSAPLTDLANRCWRAAPAAGTRAVEIILAVTAADQRINSLSLNVSPECGSDASAIVETRAPGAGPWTISSTSCPIALSGGCRINRKTPREIRIRIPAPSGWIGLSDISLD